MSREREHSSLATRDWMQNA